MSDIDLLTEKIKNWGASKLAFSFVGDYLPASLKDFKYAISIVVRLSDAIINEIYDKPTYTYFHHYRTVNTLIDYITLRTELLIQEMGYLAIAIPASQSVKDTGDEYTGVFQHKTAARLSGIGYIGKNGLLVTPEYGARVRLGTILTNMELPVNKILIDDLCDSCNICKNVCPANAIHGVKWHEGITRSEIVDARACSEYMNKNFKHIGRGSVCGLCIKFCPIGNKIIK